MKILIIGGNLFFGKKLTQLLVSTGHEVTLLNRGNRQDDFGDQVSRIQCDRNDTDSMEELLADKNWDVVFDQVCYDYKSAKNACEIFKGKVKHYIFTSSQSVYEAGANLSEEQFRPENHSFTNEETVDSNYAEAKRQAEVAFTEFSYFPTSFIRFPIVIGSDDYTGRFKFHVDRIKNGQEIYFKNLEARISFISADDAARALAHVANNKVLGPVNCCNDNSISIGALVRLIEKATKSKVVMAQEQSSDNSSPYGIDQDWFMDSSKLKDSGLQLISVEEMIQKALISVKAN